MIYQSHGKLQKLKKPAEVAGAIPLFIDPSCFPGWAGRSNETCCRFNTLRLVLAIMADLNFLP